MKNKSAIHKFWLLGVITLMGLGVAFAVPTFARAQQHVARQNSMVQAVRESSRKVDQLTRDGANNATFANANAAAVTFTLDVAASSVLSGVSSSSAAWGDYDNDGDLDILLTGYDGSGPLSRVYKNTGSGFVVDLVASNVLIDVDQGSVAWGDYDNDGDLDILLTGLDSGGNEHSRLYENTGSGFVEDVTASSALSEVFGGSAGWGDYDNDGDLDILLTGSTLSKVYENTGSDFEEDVAASSALTDVFDSSAAWGDYDNDGDLDILFTGADNSFIRHSSVFENTGSGFAEVSASSVLTGVSNGSVAWGDYNNDGDLDILLTGYDGSRKLSNVFENTGSGFLEDIAASSVLTGVSPSNVAWGDYDNDGDLDILLTGSDSEFNSVSSVFVNTGSGFIEDVAVKSVLSGIYGHSAAWGDYDNDGDLDILLTGYDGSNEVSSVYRNDGTTINTPPSPPTSLSSAVQNQQVRLSWSPPSPLTYTTPYTALTYNLRVGSAPGLGDILPPMSCVGACGISSDGYNQLPAMGAANHGLSATLNLPSGTYYWSVQAVDHTFTGSPWAAEGFFPGQAVNLPVVYR